MVVGPPDVHQPWGPCKLVPVISDVGQQVGVLAVRFDQHSVLVVAVVAAPQPQGSIVLVGRPGPLQIGKRVLHGARLDHGAFTEPSVEPDTQRLEDCSLVGQGPLPAPFNRVSAGGHLGRPVGHVGPVVAGLGGVSTGGQGGQRVGEETHLGAPVVDVELA